MESPGRHQSSVIYSATVSCRAQSGGLVDEMWKPMNSANSSKNTLNIEADEEKCNFQLAKYDHCK